MAEGNSEWESPSQLEKGTKPKRQRVKELRTKYEALSGEGSSREAGPSQQAAGGPDPSGGSSPHSEDLGSDFTDSLEARPFVRESSHREERQSPDQRGFQFTPSPIQQPAQEQQGASGGQQVEEPGPCKHQIWYEKNKDHVLDYKFMAQMICMLLREHVPGFDAREEQHQAHDLAYMLKDFVKNLQDQIQQKRLEMQIESVAAGKIRDHERKVMDIVKKLETALDEVKEENLRLKTENIRMEEKMMEAMERLKERQPVDRDEMMERQQEMLDTISDNYDKQMATLGAENAQLRKQLQECNRARIAEEEQCIRDLSQASTEASDQSELSSIMLEAIEKLIDKGTKPNKEDAAKIVEEWKRMTRDCILDNRSILEKDKEEYDNMKEEFYEFQEEFSKKRDQLEELQSDVNKLKQRIAQLKKERVKLSCKLEDMEGSQSQSSVGSSSGTRSSRGSSNQYSSVSSAEGSGKRRSPSSGDSGKRRSPSSRDSGKRRSPSSGDSGKRRSPSSGGSGGSRKKSSRSSGSKNSPAAESPRNRTPQNEKTRDRMWQSASPDERYDKYYFNPNYSPRPKQHYQSQGHSYGSDFEFKHPSPNYYGFGFLDDYEDEESPKSRTPSDRSDDQEKERRPRRLVQSASPDDRFEKHFESPKEKQYYASQGRQSYGSDFEFEYPSPGYYGFKDTPDDYYDDSYYQGSPDPDAVIQRRHHYLEMPDVGLDDSLVDDVFLPGVGTPSDYPKHYQKAEAKKYLLYRHILPSFDKDDDPFVLPYKFRDFYVPQYGEEVPYDEEEFRAAMARMDAERKANYPPPSTQAAGHSGAETAGEHCSHEQSFSKIITIKNSGQEDPLKVNVQMEPRGIKESESGQHIVCDIAVNVQNVLRSALQWQERYRQKGRRPKKQYGKGTPPVTPTEERDPDRGTPKGIFKQRHYGAKNLFGAQKERIKYKPARNRLNDTMEWEPPQFKSSFDYGSDDQSQEMDDGSGTVHFSPDQTLPDANQDWNGPGDQGGEPAPWDHSQSYHGRERSRGSHNSNYRSSA